MPSYSRGTKRDTFFACKVNPFLYYIFKGSDVSDQTGIKTSDLATLGLKKIGTSLSDLIAAASQGGTGTNGFAIGANNPRPPRVVKKISDSVSPTVKGSVSTYCAFDRLAEAMRAGWNIGNMGTDFSIKRTGKTITVGIALESILYCYNMNAADAKRYGPLLGLILATAINSDTEINKVVFGASRPKPPKVRVANKESTAASTSVVGTFSSFCSPAKYEELLRESEWHSVSKYIPLLTSAETSIT